ncbi:MAG: hypothetical protein ACRD26_13060 [Vicinamibacterales bacterium]
MLSATISGAGQGAARSQARQDIASHIKEADLVALAQRMVRIRSDYDEGVLANHKDMAAFSRRPSPQVESTRTLTLTPF